MELVIIVDSDSDVPLMDETVRVEPVIVVKYPVVVDKVGTRMDDRTVKEEVTLASWVNRKLDWMDETVRVDPVNVVKYPVVVDKVGTRMDDRTVKEEVTLAS